jgi:uncharacterized protein (UPF0333 family)
MFGFVLLAVIVFAVVSTFVYFKKTDATKSVPARVWDSVKMGAFAAVAAVSGAASQVLGQ